MKLSQVMLTVLAAAVLLISGCGPKYNCYIDFTRQTAPEKEAVAEDVGQKPIRIALATVLSPRETISYYRQIAQHISERTGRPTVLVQRKTYEELNLLMANGEADIAFLSTGAYSAYHGMNEIEILAMQNHNGHSTYTTYLAVHKDSTVQTLDDLQGKVFAFTDPLSHSGHISVVNQLKNRHTTPEKFFQRYIYTYSHDKSLLAVANKVVDGACVDDQIVEYVGKRNPEIVANVRVIDIIDPAPTGPIVVSKNLNPAVKEELRSIFLDMHHYPEVQKAMQGVMIDRFVSPQPEMYEKLRAMYEQVRGLP